MMTTGSNTDNKLIPDEPANNSSKTANRNFDLGIPDDCIEKRAYAPIPGSSSFDDNANYMVEPEKEGFLRRIFRKIFG